MKFKIKEENSEIQRRCQHIAGEAEKDFMKSGFRFLSG
jgi:hypothetical protein